VAKKLQRKLSVVAMRQSVAIVANVKKDAVVDVKTRRTNQLKQKKTQKSQTKQNKEI
jgi:hypothetical protein